MLADHLDLIQSAVEAGRVLAAVLHAEGGVEPDDDPGPRLAGDPARDIIPPRWPGESQHKEEQSQAAQAE